MDFNDRSGTNPFGTPAAHGAAPAAEHEPHASSSEVLPYQAKTSSSTGRAAAWRLTGRVLPLSAGTFGSLFNPS